MPIGTTEKKEYWLMIRRSKDGGSMTSIWFSPMSASYCSSDAQASRSISTENTVVPYLSMICWYLAGSRSCSSCTSIRHTTESCASIRSRFDSVAAK